MNELGNANRLEAVGVGTVAADDVWLKGRVHVKVGVGDGASPLYLDLDGRGEDKIRLKMENRLGRRRGLMEPGAECAGAIVGGVELACYRVRVIRCCDKSL